ncbi:general stress protein [Microbacterium halophytorum]|uniref:general stress protein n=1 Tax=Microbacterium halophytorum TaxID=2067568 RepID=UPI000CFDE8B1|nr:general stress protein [Microbacterium halophytorum]
MSMMGGGVRSPKDIGETVASYDEYEAAQKAVGKLIEAEVPAREISIVWAGLRAVEMITGRLGYGRAAWSGALNGAVLGLLFGAIYTLVTPQATLQLLVGFLLVGMALGMLMRLLTYRMVRRRRDYSSATSPVADHYEVAVQAAHIATARRVLGIEAQQRRTEPVRPSGPLPPPQYGIRLDPATNQPIPYPEAPPAEQAPAQPVVAPSPRTAPPGPVAAPAEPAAAPDQPAAPDAEPAAPGRPPAAPEQPAPAPEQDAVPGRAAPSAPEPAEAAPEAPADATEQAEREAARRES